MEFKCANCLQSHEKPKLLCCFHVFCDSCLSQCIQKDQDNHYSLSCPICKLITFISTNEIASLPTVKVISCSEHKSSSHKLYCETCQEVVCSECAPGKHSNHKNSQISQVFPKHRGEIEDKLAPLNDKLGSVSRFVEQLESQISLVSTKEKLIESGILNMTGVIEEALQSRRKELNKQLHFITSSRLDVLASRKHKFIAVQAQLSSCIGFIRESLRSCDQEKLLLMKNTLLKQVELLLCEKHVLNLVKCEDDFGMKLEASPQFLMEGCLKFGKIVTSNSQLDSTSMKSYESFSSANKNPELHKMLAYRLGTPLLTLTDLKGPCGVAVNQNGEVIVAEGCADRISVFDPSGKKLHSFGQCGTEDGEFSCPCELDIDDAGNILVVDGSNRRIQKFTSKGKFLASVGRSGVGVLQFLEPDGIAIHPINGKIYVVDNNAHRIQILNPDLTFCKMFGREGNGMGYLHYPWGVACSCSGEVYVTDSGNCRVQVFSCDGQFLREFGKMGTGHGELKWPTGISVSKNGCIVYVSDYGNHRVSIFSCDGQFLKSIGKKGKHTGEFGNIRGVKVDRNGLVYVCDTDNNRVVLY